MKKKSVLVEKATRVVHVSQHAWVAPLVSVWVATCVVSRNVIVEPVMTTFRMWNPRGLIFFPSLRLWML